MKLATVVILSLVLGVVDYFIAALVHGGPQAAEQWYIPLVCGVIGGILACFAANKVYPFFLVPILVFASYFGFVFTSRGGIRIMLEKIISGAQTGADIGGLQAAKEKGLLTGGTIPKGWKTQDGPKPEYAELYGIIEHESANYVPRTYQNAKDGDGTIRIAGDLFSSGEKCTLKAIQQYQKPHFDVHVKDVNHFALDASIHPKNAAQWIVDNKIKVLNVAGNSERTCPGIGVFARRYISALIDEVRKLSQGK